MAKGRGIGEGVQVHGEGGHRRTARGEREIYLQPREGSEGMMVRMGSAWGPGSNTGWGPGCMAEGPSSSMGGEAQQGLTIQRWRARPDIFCPSRIPRQTVIAEAGGVIPSPGVKGKLYLTASSFE